jgi:hypothetical protein
LTANYRLFQLLIGGLVLVLLVSPANLVHADAMGPWTSTTSYPLQLAGASCATLSERVYCVGGFDSNQNSYNDVYYAPLSASGIGTWSASTPYPTAIDSASCVNVTAGIYCVGGEDGSAVLNDVYLGSFPSPQLGSNPPSGGWSSQAAYPKDVAATSCVAYSGYVYCVGGFDDNGNEVSSTYYASISSGLRSWSSTTQYPLAVDGESCIVYAGSIYCVAGETVKGSNQNSPISNVYYAPLSSSGIGKWSAASAYPAALAALSCVGYLDSIYCVGGFGSNLLSSSNAYSGGASGVSPWASATPYPVPIDTASCVTATGYIYCVGGTSVLSSDKSMLSSAYYAPIAAFVHSTVTATTPEFPVTVALPFILALGLLVVGELNRLTGKETEPEA